MKRRWFIAGLAMPVIAAGCQPAANRLATPTSATEIKDRSSGRMIAVTRDRTTLVMATAANYPPYEQLASESVVSESLESESLESESLESGSAASPSIIGFDIDVAQLIAQRLARQLATVDLEFDALIPAVVEGQVDMVMAALEPRADRKQRVDFSDIYYRSRQSLISIGGVLRSPDLSYQSIGVRTSSVQARYANRLTDELSDLNIVLFDTLDEIFTALTDGTLAGAIVESTVAIAYLRRYPDCGAQFMPSEQAIGSAIALPKNSPLRSDINQAIIDIKASGEMDRLIEKWFS
jgi:arginine/lysine/histidine transporter system substrate-binding protein